MAVEPKVVDVVREETRPGPHEHKAPGTMVLTLVFLLSFAVYFFANWKALADVWHVR